MRTLAKAATPKRYEIVTEEKAGGATYTPKILADFVARQIVQHTEQSVTDRAWRVLDPAIGDGELLLSLLGEMSRRGPRHSEVYGFETDPKALEVAVARVKQHFPDAEIHFELGNFLEFVLERFGADGHGSLFGPAVPEAFDLIIANPPYVRTQIMGAPQARLLAEQFGLGGRVDLYYAFILGMASVLQPHGVAGIIVSNRFMTTRSGASVRHAVQQRFNLRHVWDLGDTKLFDAAVLPAVLLAEGKKGHNPETPRFTSIYQTDRAHDSLSQTPIDALSRDGVVQTGDGRRFLVQHGTLDAGGIGDGVWRVATTTGDAWLAAVEEHTWGTFRDIGKIRVGVKTCADSVFIRSDWGALPKEEQPEALRPLITHHIGRRFKAQTPERKILYPHEVVQGQRRAMDLSLFPRSRAYLERHRTELEDRTYVIEAGRAWYEIWVPQDPAAWDQPKLVFRDISEEPVFWIDHDGAVVNGDCYWLTCQNPAQTDLLWLAAAVGNSTFIEHFYDHRFNNKLYAGRRRFITQYVEKFPLPEPHSALGKEIIATARQVYECIPALQAKSLEAELDRMVWQTFGLSAEEVRG